LSIRQFLNITTNLKLSNLGSEKTPNPRKKWTRKDNIDRLLSLLEKNKELINKQLREKLEVSDPTLAGYIKTLVKDGKIEMFLKQGDRRKKWYRIKHEKEEQVKTQLGIHEAIAFIESINSPLSVYKLDKGRAVAAFMTGTGDSRADSASRMFLNAQVSLALKGLKSPNIANRKIALILMTGVEP
jgi:DNA-binding MarR family transcriptional regulator